VSKVTVVGAGNVGSNTARRVAERRLVDEVVMTDIVDGLPQGLALDINHSAAVEGFETRVVGTNSYEDTANSDVAVITAGLPRQPGMSRMDLLDKNAEIVRGVTEQLVERSPEAVMIVVSNPLDEMTFLASIVSGFPKERVMGMAGVLDSARLCFFIAEKLNVPPTEVEAITLGSHGDQMVALPRHAKVQGRFRSWSTVRRSRSSSSARATRARRSSAISRRAARSTRRRLPRSRWSRR